MGWLKSLFRKQSRGSEPGASTEEMRRNPNLVQVYDEYGREAFITKEVWRKDVLPGALQQQWNDPEQLYGLIVGTLNDGFHQDVVDAAFQLNKIHPSPVLGATILGIVLMKNGRLDEAESTLQSCIARHGREGVLLTNLAKVYAKRGDDQRSEECLWEAIEADPNQENAVQWWAAIHYERDGDAGYLAALEKVAALDGSWYALLWLARAALDHGNADEALERYERALNRAGDLPAEAMMQISGDLGNAGRQRDLVQLLGGRFDPEKHGLMAGNNLVKAYIELGELASAKRMLQQLYAQNRPDWAEHLAYWDDEIDKLSGRYGPVTNEAPPGVVVLTVDAPVWSLKLKGRDALLPNKEPGAPCIAFVSCTCTAASAVSQVQRANTQGILSRGIPLLMAEQVLMQTNASSVMFVPVIEGQGSFVLGGSPWQRETLVRMAEGFEPAAMISGHIETTNIPWELRLDVLPGSGLEGAALAEVRVAVDPSSPSPAVLEATSSIMEALREHCSLTADARSTPYSMPGGVDASRYVDAIEKSLALSAATAEGFDGSSLYGERSILDTLLGMALDAPTEPVCQLLFLSALAKNRSYGSEIYLEYRRKAEKLLEEHGHEGPAGDAARATFESLYLG